MNFIGIFVTPASVVLAVCISTLCKPNVFQKYNDRNIQNYNFACCFLRVGETWSLTLREECRLRVFGNRVMRSLFGCKRNQVTGEWRSLQHEELNDLYSSSYIIWVIKSRRMRWAGYIACMGEKRDVYRVLVGKPEGKRPLGWCRRRWRHNIKMDRQVVR